MRFGAGGWSMAGTRLRLFHYYGETVALGWKVFRDPDTAGEELPKLEDQPEKGRTVIKVAALIPSRPDITTEKFHSHWRDPHGELAKRITTLRRYQQSHWVGAGVPGVPESIYRGIAEVWFDGLDVALGMGDDPNYTDYAGADEPNFIDQSRLAFLFLDERAVAPGPGYAQGSPETKAMLLLKRKAGVTKEAFRVGLGTAAVDAAAAATGAERYVPATTHDVLYADGADPLYDGLVELSWPSREAFERGWASGGPGYLGRLAEVADLGRSASHLAEPYRVIWE